MDNSSEMIKVINEKIRSSEVKNLRALNFNLETDDVQRMENLTLSSLKWYCIT